MKRLSYATSMMVCLVLSIVFFVGCGASGSNLKIDSDGELSWKHVNAAVGYQLHLRATLIGEVENIDVISDTIPMAALTLENGRVNMCNVEISSTKDSELTSEQGIAMLVQLIAGELTMQYNIRAVFADGSTGSWSNTVSRKAPAVSF
jgi:hypothetical protein